MRPIIELTERIAELPGIGPRQARRVVQFLLRTDQSFKKKLAESILSINEHVAQCRSCFKFDQLNAEKVCPQCADPNRSKETLMVVEKDVDIESIESAGAYGGRYFVLGSLIPIATQRKTAIAPRVPELVQNIKEHGLKEIILAFATTPEGDYTARELKKKIAEAMPQAKVSILGRGLSLGAEIEYADQETLRSALSGRLERF